MSPRFVKRRVVLVVTGTLLFTISGLAITAALFVLGLNTAEQNAESQLVQLCHGKLTELLKELAGGITVMLGMLDAIVSAGGYTAMSPQTWRSCVQYLITQPGWRTTAVGYATYFNDSLVAKMWADDRNLTIFGIDGLRPDGPPYPTPLNRSEYLIIVLNYPTDIVVGLDLLAPGPAVQTFALARSRQEPVLSLPRPSAGETGFIEQSILAMYPHTAEDGQLLGAVVANFEGSQVMNRSATTGVFYRVRINNITFQIDDEFPETNLKVSQEASFASREVSVLCGTTYIRPKHNDSCSDIWYCSCSAGPGGCVGQLLAS